MLSVLFGDILAPLEGLPPDEQRAQLLSRRAEILARIDQTLPMIQLYPSVREFRALLERLDTVAAPDLPPLLQALIAWRQEDPGPGSTRAGGIILPPPGGIDGDKALRSLNPWPDDDDHGDGEPPPGPVPRGAQ